jgi:hypothetical protein
MALSVVSSDLSRMHFPTFRRTVLWAGVIGLVLPITVMSLFWPRVLRMAGMWLVYIWPSSIMLMATENMRHSAEVFSILALSIGINVVLYVVVSSILWSLAWVIRAWRLSLRDGTTI